MSTEKTLYGKALSNYNCAKILRDNILDDDNQLNIIAYHIQQAIELMIKYYLEQAGVEYTKTHSIEQLIQLARKEKVELHLTEYVEDHSEMLSQWEAKCRYVLDYLVELSKIDKMLKELDSIFGTD